jgi:magnesium transporter
MPYDAFARDASGAVRRLETDDQVVAAFVSRSDLLWMHISAITPEDGVFLQQRLGFHPLAVEDCLSSAYHRPKVEEYGDTLFFALHGIDYERSGEQVETTELDLFVGETFVVSSTITYLPWCDHLLTQAEHLLARDAGSLAYTIIDALVDSVLPIVERMDEVAESVEDEVLERPAPALLDHIMRLKRSVAMVQRVMVPQREIAARAARGDYAVLDGDNRVFFRDVADHLVRIEDLVGALRERSDYLVVTYHSALSLRQNESMRQLAVVASIFLPLTLLAGIYGMNFEHMPELGWEWGYFAVVGFMAVAILAGAVWLWGRAWLGWGRRSVSRVLSYAIDPLDTIDQMARGAAARAHMLESAWRPRPPHDPPEGGPDTR